MQEIEKECRKAKGLFLVSYCRFGNNIIQLDIALRVCKHYGINWIGMPGFRSFYEVNPNFKKTSIQGVDVYRNPPNEKDMVSGKFFRAAECPPLPIVNEDAKETFHEIGQKVLGLKNIKTSKDIHVHIRSGDIFKRLKPKKNYVQPPLAFYQRAILDELDKTPSAKVVVVYENKNNPVIDALFLWLGKNRIKYKDQSGSLADDVRELATARTIIAGKGSFVPMIACMTGANVIFFREISIPENLYKQCGISPEVYFDTGGYISENNWKISAVKDKAHRQQLKQLVDYPIENIRLKNEN